MINFLKGISYRIRELSGLETYRKRRVYTVHYTVSILNTSSLSQNISVIMPVPSDMEYQTLAQQPRLHPANAIITRESMYGNRYAVIDARIAPGKTEECSESFAIGVIPRVYEFGKKKYLLEDYSEALLQKHEIYLRPDRYSNSEDEDIRNRAKSIQGEERDVEIIIERINVYVIETLRYGHPIPGLYSAEEACTKEVVDCGGFDTLFIALSRACGIPARIICGFWAGYSLSTMHAWVEILFPDGEWIAADPSIEHLRKKGKRVQSGRLGYIGSDRIAFSIGCDIPIQRGKHTTHVDILQHPIVIAQEGESSITTRLMVTTRNIPL